MPIEFRARLPASDKADASRLSSDQNNQSRQASYFGASVIQRSVDEEFLTRTARDNENSGFHSALIAQRSTWPEVAALATWVLANTKTLKIVMAHRIGLQQPTVAARALATIDRLSQGRALVHFILGSTEEDQRRDGDFLAKADRYRRAGEYLEIFNRLLTGSEPFDFEGEFYRVENAIPSVHPVQSPRPVLSIASAADEGLDLAARHVDTYALSAEPLAETREILTRVKSRADKLGKRLRFWRDANFILAPTDEAARAKAETLKANLAANASGANNLSLFSPQSVGGQRGAEFSARGDWHDRALYTGISKFAGSGPAFVGSPETVAEAVLDYYDLGIETYSIGAPAVTQEDRELRDDLLRRLAAGSQERDQQCKKGLGAA
ncbi:hypothetical protein ACO34A_24095 (plasmid) [Rhizobium sp. ACO-34A]|nr:LLM class flavin-dependent oxidoreductase [Rhizobium sp. ACO-34A]ATN36861.1 hypothetical protein ACO34A_24095 [Rhizobium sp. ACO-34A]